METKTWLRDMLRKLKEVFGPRLEGVLMESQVTEPERRLPGDVPQSSAGEFTPSP